MRNEAWATMAVCAIGIATVFFMTTHENPEPEKNAEFRIQYISNHNPALFDAKLYSYKHNNWIFHGEYDRFTQPIYWEVGAITHVPDEVKIISIPNVSHLAIQFIPETGIEIDSMNITGNANYTNSFDIDGDEQPDHVYLYKTTWDDSMPTLDKEVRNETIFVEGIDSITRNITWEVIIPDVEIVPYVDPVILRLDKIIELLEEQKLKQTMRTLSEVQKTGEYSHLDRWTITEKDTSCFGYYNTDVDHDKQVDFVECVIND